jgi:hypothetical protein
MVTRVKGHLGPQLLLIVRNEAYSLLCASSWGLFSQVLDNSFYEGLPKSPSQDSSQSMNMSFFTGSTERSVDKGNFYIIIYC